VSFRTILVLFFVSTTLWASELVPATKAATATATEPRVYKKTIKGDFTATYQKVFTSLENNGYFVLIEPNIGKNLSNYEQRWGNNYNKNQLEAIRSLVFCNGWYANEMYPQTGGNGNPVCATQSGGGAQPGQKHCGRTGTGCNPGD